MMELSSFGILVEVSSCSKTGSKRDNPYWIPRKNSLQLIK